jgi:hypothetical protein
MPITDARGVSVEIVLIPWQFDGQTVTLPLGEIGREKKRQIGS